MKRKVISMMQPYAWLFVNGHLSIDDRSFDTFFRGELLIHASKKLHEPYMSYIRKHSIFPLPQTFEHGGIIGKVNLVEVLKPGQTISNLPLVKRSHFGFTRLPDGNMQLYYGWVMKDPEPLVFKETRGFPGLFEID